MTLHIYSSNAHSEGAASLAETLGCRRIRHRNSTFVGGPNRTVINWGATEVPQEVEASSIINRPPAVRLASNKLRFFEFVSQHGDEALNLPEWTTDIAQANAWIVDEGGTLVCARASLSGHSAEGLTIHSRHDIPTVPLYTKYVPKKYEFRVHVVRDNIIDIQQKVKRADFEGTPNFRIRNHDGGFIFQRQGLQERLAEPVLESVREQARLVMDCLPLDFGAVDIIYNERRTAAYVLEVNTAPGLAPETCRNYADAFRRL